MLSGHLAIFWVTPADHLWVVRETILQGKPLREGLHAHHLLSARSRTGTYSPDCRLPRHCLARQALQTGCWKHHQIGAQELGAPDRGCEQARADLELYRPRHCRPRQTRNSPHLFCSTCKMVLAGGQSLGQPLHSELLVFK